MGPFISPFLDIHWTILLTIHRTFLESSAHSFRAGNLTSQLAVLGRNGPMAVRRTGEMTGWREFAISSSLKALPGAQQNSSSQNI